jgi:hypothetical protein
VEAGVVVVMMMMQNMASGLQVAVSEQDIRRLG